MNSERRELGAEPLGPMTKDADGREQRDSANIGDLICSPKYGGCGYSGPSDTFERGDDEGDIVLCPVCYQDHAFQLTAENYASLTEEVV